MRDVALLAAVPTVPKQAAVAVWRATRPDQTVWQAWHSGADQAGSLLCERIYVAGTDNHRHGPQGRMLPKALEQFHAMIVSVQPHIHDYKLWLLLADERKCILVVRPHTWIIAFVQQ